MPALANIVLNDGKSTPVAHTFVPHTGQATDNPSTSFEKSAGIYVGFEKLTTQVRRSESQRANRVNLQLSVPTLAVTAPSTGTGIQPTPTVAYNCLAKVEFVFPDACTLQDRKDLRVLIVNALQNSIILDAIDNISPVY